MQDKVLIDTSVWIGFFRNRDVALKEKIELLLKSRSAVFTGIIVLELTNGAKNKKELNVLKDLFDTMEIVNERESTYFGGGKLGHEIARKGFILGAVDLLIAQIAIENNLKLMTFDEHFKVITKFSQLKLWSGLI